jgi:selenocysteine-specific elongation factor
LLLEIDKGLLLSAGVFRELCNELQEEFAEQPELSVADIRDRWQVTRKHAIPFLEYCDQKKVTDRRGNVRTAGTALQDFTS